MCHNDHEKTEKGNNMNSSNKPSYKSQSSFDIIYSILSFRSENLPNFQENIYNRILSKYLEYLQNGFTKEISLFISNELIKLMWLLPQKSNPIRPLMENIISNAIILLLTLFPQKVNSNDFKNFSQLSADEHNLVIKALDSLFSESNLL